jgi:hypothetical protein
MNYLQWSFWIVGLGLQYLVLAALLSGDWKRYWTIVLYLCCVVGTTIADISFALDASTNTRNYYYFFYFAELIRQTALYLVVVSLVLQVLPDSRIRKSLVQLLVFVALVFWAGSLLVHRHEKIGVWMVPVIRNLSFCSALANMALWFTMVASEKRDQKLLMITGALGIQMTGDAIGQSLMHLSKATTSFGQIIGVATHFVCLWVWWQAFQGEPTPNRTRTPASIL